MVATVGGHPKSEGEVGLRSTLCSKRTIETVIVADGADKIYKRGMIEANQLLTCYRSGRTNTTGPKRMWHVPEPPLAEGRL